MSETRLDNLNNTLLQTGYVADRALLISLDLMQTLAKPLLLEGEAGVGKTGIATSLSKATGYPLIRLQCYEGLDAQQVLYDWDYQRQLLAIQMLKAENQTDTESDTSARLNRAIYSNEFLLKRPLLEAISAGRQTILLIDEIDRADEEFEAMLLEVLAENQITVPELGTFQATCRPHVILTSNAIRELSDALRRRCLYHYIEFPDEQKELSIVHARLPDIDKKLAQQAVRLVQGLRKEPLRKTPGIAETLDWLAALCSLQISELSADPQALDNTLPALLKTRADQLKFRQHGALEKLLQHPDSDDVNNTVSGHAPN